MTLEEAKAWRKSGLHKCSLNDGEREAVLAYGHEIAAMAILRCASLMEQKERSKNIKDQIEKDGLRDETRRINN